MTLLTVSMGQQYQQLARCLRGRDGAVEVVLVELPNVE